MSCRPLRRRSSSSRTTPAISGSCGLRASKSGPQNGVLVGHLAHRSADVASRRTAVAPVPLPGSRPRQPARGSRSSPSVGSSSGTTSRRRSTSIAPTRSTRGVGPVHVDDRGRRRRAGARAAVEVDGAPRRPSWSTASSRWSPAGWPVRLALETASGPVLRAAGRGRRVRRHAGPRPCRRRRPRSQARRRRVLARPGSAPPGQNASASCVRHRRQARRPGRPSVDASPTSTGTGMSRPRPLAASSPVDRGRGERVGADAVDGVGRQHDQLAAADRGGGGVEAGRRAASGSEQSKSQPRGCSPHCGSASRRAVANRGPARRGRGGPRRRSTAAVRAHQRRQRARPAGRRARSRASRPGAAAARR